VNGKYTQYSIYVVKREVLTINQHITRNLTEFELMLICMFSIVLTCFRKCWVFLYQYYLWFFSTLNQRSNSNVMFSRDSFTCVWRCV